MRSYFAAAAVLLACVAAQDSHDSHDSHDETHDSHEEEGGHDSHEGEGGHFEAAAVYDVTAGTNTFVVVPAEGSFDDETFAFMIVPAPTADMEGLEVAEEEAETAWDAYIAGGEPTALAAGDAAVPDAGVVYQIALQDPLVVVNVDVTAATAGANAFFLEHGAAEITTALANPAGAVLAAGAQEGAVAEDADGEEEEEDESRTATGSQWGNALAASFIVSLCSLAGIIVIVNKQVAHNIGLSHAFIFASGALLTASLLHIIPEALEGLSEKYDSLHDTGLYAGLSVLGGLSFGLLIHAMLDTGHSHDADVPHAGVPVPKPEGAPATGVSAEMLAKDKAAGNGNSSAIETGTPFGTTQPPSPAEKTPDNLDTLIHSREGRSLLDLKGLQPVCWNVILGDLVHNFADGVTIGAAFLSCSSTIGWTVAASAVLHEVPHEIADFMALMNGGMSVKQAFAYNFLSALSAVLGTIIILALGGEMSASDISIILLIGAGSFIFIALAELMPEAMAVTRATSQQGGNAVVLSQGRKLATFVLGGILVGIPLIFDQHCEADGHDH